jgi:hypothetical protein
MTIIEKVALICIPIALWLGWIGWALSGIRYYLRELVVVEAGKGARLTEYLNESKAENVVGSEPRKPNGPHSVVAVVK